MKSKSSEEKWKNKLTKEQYRVLRKKGTEPAFTGKCWNNHEKGIYKCAACGTPLFSSDKKFDSGTGWPSFYEPIDKENVEEELDTSYGMKRTEVLCKNCGGHLGHAFDDVPKNKGCRYCINSISLNFDVNFQNKC